MAKTKKFRPAKTSARKPKQPKLPGFTSPMLEEIEIAAEDYKAVEDEVKEKRKELTKELDEEQTKLIAVMRKHGQESIVINGLSIRIIEKEKAEVKGVPKLKSEREEPFKDEVRNGLQEMGVAVVKSEAAE
jgi:hypothetical protein